MPRTANRLPTTTAYLDLRLAAVAKGEARDCGVKAVAAAAQVSYDEAHALLKQLGRKNGCGTPLHMILKAMEILGHPANQIQQTEITSRYPGKHSQKTQVTAFQPDRFPQAWRDGCTYLMVTDGHILCVRNGENIDWSRGESLRAKLLYRVA